MPKRSSYELRNRILGSVRERPASYAKIERNVDTNHYSVKAHCKELEEDGFVTIKKIDKNPTNGKVSYAKYTTLLLNGGLQANHLSIGWYTGVIKIRRG